MKLLEAPFVKRFIKLCTDGYAKGWHERNGGNLSYRMIDEEVELVKENFDESTPWIKIGASVPALANMYFLVKCTGAFMMHMADDPLHCLGIIHLDEKGENYRIVCGMLDGRRPTSELPSHLMNLEVVMKRTNGKYRVVYHCHPVNSIALSFVMPLNDKEWSHKFWEMMTECPIIFPAGIGVTEWMVPGGEEIAKATSKLMETYDVAIWAHHGIFVTGDSFDNTWGLAETVEKSAEIYVKVLSMGGIKQTIPDDGFRALQEPYHVHVNPDFLD